MTDIGERTERISFRRQGRVKRADFGYDATPSTLATVWADVRPVQANENEEAGRLVGETSYLMTIEFDDLPSDLTTDDSIVWDTGGSLIMNIKAIRKPPNRMMSVEIVAVAGVTE